MHIKLPNTIIVCFFGYETDLAREIHEQKPCYTKEHEKSF